MGLSGLILQVTEQTRVHINVSVLWSLNHTGHESETLTGWGGGGDLEGRGRGERERREDEVILLSRFRPITTGANVQAVPILVDSVVNLNFVFEGELKLCFRMFKALRTKLGQFVREGGGERQTDRQEADRDKERDRTDTEIFKFSRADGGYYFFNGFIRSHLTEFLSPSFNLPVICDELLLFIGRMMSTAGLRMKKTAGCVTGA